MPRLMLLVLVVPLAIAGCNKPTPPPAAAAPASPFAGWSTPEALQARLAEKVELSEIESDGGAGPPPSPWSQATELTARGAGPKDLLGALSQEVLARVQRSSWHAAELKDGPVPGSFELAYDSGDHRGRITVRITSPVADFYRIEVGGEEKSVSRKAGKRQKEQ